jgi:hypothetical protein
MSLIISNLGWPAGKEIGATRQRQKTRREPMWFDSIERLYNLKRRDSMIGYLGPIEFEQRANFA